jgi:hypothetical protein
MSSPDHDGHLLLSLDRMPGRNFDLESEHKASLDGFLDP